MSSIEYINSLVVTSASNSIVFSNINQSYQDLILTTNIKGSATAYPYILINNSTANMSRLWMGGYGTSTSSSKSPDSYIVGGVNWNSSDNSFTSQTNFLGYSNTNIFKTFISSVANASIGVESVVSLWRSTNAINSIEYVSSSGNISVGSTLTLWGVK